MKNRIAKTIFITVDKNTKELTIEKPKEAFTYLYKVLVILEGDSYTMWKELFEDTIKHIIWNIVKDQKDLILSGTDVVMANNLCTIIFNKLKDKSPLLKKVRLYRNEAFYFEKAF